jgi:hypothetical protein
MKVRILADNLLLARVAPLERERKSDSYDNKMLLLGFEPGISDSKGVASRDIRLQIPAVASSSLLLLIIKTTPCHWHSRFYYL